MNTYKIIYIHIIYFYTSTSYWGTVYGADDNTLKISQ